MAELLIRVAAEVACDLLFATLAKANELPRVYTDQSGRASWRVILEAPGTRGLVPGLDCVEQDRDLGGRSD